MTISQIAIVPYERRYRRDIMHLIQTDDRLHIHLDWTTVDEWINEPDVPLFMAWRERQLLGAIAASPVLSGSSWLRLVALNNQADAEAVIQALWSPFTAQLASKGITELAVLILRPWIAPYMQQLGFTYYDSIITLRRDGSSYPAPLRTDLNVRNGELREIAHVVEVDHAAFRPLWQLSEASLRQAARLSSSFRVAEMDRKIVAYQISTMYRDGAHLARLATIPTLQGTGVGGLIVSDLIEQLLQRNVRSLTVNTNQTNSQSLNLYKRYGFTPTGMDMEVWQVKIG